ncbi:YybH family protein [Inhella proteolytica]|uniref:Nuclear transport factor 2 family protein n=1 Tax=Inhella proteolytica TaxID=2795029 RepID=A0A931NK01_9BURK|nr:nuclear transport factor 2 family protein [Inhella proteolytica]MBH9579185.1 nuclear transport factor 2 family protein [Inhella proteolytica]
MLRFVPALVFSLFTLSAQAQAPASMALPPEFEQLLRQYETAWRGKDLDALVALFEPQGYALSSEQQPVQGRAAIRAHYAPVAGGPLSLRAFAVERSGPLAVLLGAYRYGPGPADQGKFTLTLRQDAQGQWRILSDMDNGNTPPPRRAAG